MSKFRKKPVVIEAHRWEPTENGRNKNPWPNSHLEALHFSVALVSLDLIIPTLEGEMRASPGDWIIKGVNGEFYPCKPDIFEKTYEPESAKPPASEGVRELLQWVLDNVPSVFWQENKFRGEALKKISEALAALPELEKRLCWRLRIDGERKHPKDCYECNGHGEVWVRKAGV